MRQLGCRWDLLLDEIKTANKSTITLRNAAAVIGQAFSTAKVSNESSNMGGIASYVPIVALSDLGKCKMIDTYLATRQIVELHYEQGRIADEGVFHATHYAISSWTRASS